MHLPRQIVLHHSTHTHTHTLKLGAVDSHRSYVALIPLSKSDVISRTPNATGTFNTRWSDYHNDVGGVEYVVSRTPRCDVDARSFVHVLRLDGPVHTALPDDECIVYTGCCLMNRLMAATSLTHDELCSCHAKVLHRLIYIGQPRATKHGENAFTHSHSAQICTRELTHSHTWLTQPHAKVL